VREKLRETTGKEKASVVFNNSAQNTAHYKALFGKTVPASDAEADFFRGIGYSHLGVQASAHGREYMRRPLDDEFASLITRTRPSSGDTMLTLAGLPEALRCAGWVATLRT
jgi:hypothetical protein